MALNFQNLVAQVLPITICSAAMVKEKGRLSRIGIFELGEQFSALDIPATLCALFCFKHCFLTSEGPEQAFAIFMSPLKPFQSIFGIISGIQSLCHARLYFGDDGVPQNHGQRLTSDARRAKRNDRSALQFRNIVIEVSPVRRGSSAKKVRSIACLHRVFFRRK